MVHLPGVYQEPTLSLRAYICPGVIHGQTGAPRLGLNPPPQGCSRLPPPQDCLHSRWVRYEGMALPTHMLT
jgi:hypothetical protein